MCVGHKETYNSSFLFLQLSLCLLCNLFTQGSYAQMHTCFFMEVLVFLNFVDGLNKAGGGHPTCVRLHCDLQSALQQMPEFIQVQHLIWHKPGVQLHCTGYFINMSFNNLPQFL